MLLNSIFKPEIGAWSIHSEMEMKFIKNKLVKGNQSYMWVGGYETDGGAKWHWQDGSVSRLTSFLSTSWINLRVKPRKALMI